LAAYNVSLGNMEKTVVSQIQSTAMDRRVAVKAQRDQIAFTIAACVAAKLFVVDFKVGRGTAQLTSPAISP